MIAGYNGEPIPLPAAAASAAARMKIEGFIVSEHMEVWPEALKELGTHGRAPASSSTARASPRASAPAPEAFLGLLKGKNFGKQLVKLV